MPSLAETSGGRYRCEVQNNIGVSTQTFDLFILSESRNTLEMSRGERE